MIRTVVVATLITAAGAALVGGGTTQARALDSTPPAAVSLAAAPSFSVRYHTVKIDGLDVFYREAGPKDAPVILLLHGFPTSSHMYRNLIPALADTYRVIAPDYPGYGNSSMPSPTEFEYSFDNLAKVVDKFTEAVGAKTFALYVQDYGAPIGFRIASAHPERITGLIIQNGNAYEEGLRDFWVPFKAYWKEQTAENKAALTPYFELSATKWQWTHGVKDPTTISPDTWTLDQAGMDRPGNKEIQLALFMSYGTNPPLYPKWQEYFRTHQPPTLIVWGKNDFIFPAEGAEPYKRDLKNLDFNLLDTGHFALEEQGGVIAEKIRTFMQDKAKK
ncbi:MAG: alpha/beta fold hydrolase [Phycisphaerales bacterium]